MWHSMITQLAAQNLLLSSAERGEQLEAHITIVGLECFAIRTFVEALTGAPAQPRHKMDTGMSYAIDADGINR